MSYRSFPEEIEAIAKAWSNSACTDEKWEELGPFGGTESRPFRVRTGNVIGLAKLVQEPGIRLCLERPTKRSPLISVITSGCRSRQ